LYVDSDASGLMCTANTKTDTKSKGVQGKCPKRPVCESWVKANKNRQKLTRLITQKLKQRLSVEGEIVATKLDALGCCNNLGELPLRGAKVHTI
jgi:hypothetical protein